MKKKNPIKEFYLERASRVSDYSGNKALKHAARDFEDEATKAGYEYNFDWLGRPIIQFPQDIVAMQELIWRVKPDLIIETGIAHGGSLVFSASMLALLDTTDAATNKSTFDPRRSNRKVLGIDIDIRAHNRAQLESHPLSGYIDMIEGSSVDKVIISKVHEQAEAFSNVLVCLDSNHTHAHVLAELQAYANLVTKDSYIVVFDSNIEDLPAEFFPDRPWGKGNNPKTAIWEFLDTHHEFEVDRSIEDKLLVSVAPNGYLRRISS